MFDDDHLVSLAGLVPVMTLADQTHLPQLLAEKVSIAAPRRGSRPDRRTPARSWPR